MLPKVLVVLGPTAVGKTALAAACAHRHGGEIISADSRQVYRKLNVGTGKDLNQLENIKYHLIDIVEPGNRFSLKQFQYHAYKAIQEILSRNKIPIICGGTGLYLEAVVQGYKIPAVKPDFSFRDNLENKSLEEIRKIANNLQVEYDQGSSKRRVIRNIEIKKYQHNSELPPYTIPQYDYLIIGITAPRSVQKKNIRKRLEQRFEQGMIEEVRDLIDQGLSIDWLTSIGLEYKWVTLYITDRISYKEMTRELSRAIISFSKRQNSWFRRMERKGYKIHWFEQKNEHLLLRFLDRYFNSKNE